MTQYLLATDATLHIIQTQRGIIMLLAITVAALLAFAAYAVYANRKIRQRNVKLYHVLHALEAYRKIMAEHGLVISGDGLLVRTPHVQGGPLKLSS